MKTSVQYHQTSPSVEEVRAGHLLPAQHHSMPVQTPRELAFMLDNTMFGASRARSHTLQVLHRHHACLE